MSGWESGDHLGWRLQLQIKCRAWSRWRTRHPDSRDVLGRKCRAPQHLARASLSQSPVPGLLMSSWGPGGPVARVPSPASQLLRCPAMSVSRALGGSTLGSQPPGLLPDQNVGIVNALSAWEQGSCDVEEETGGSPSSARAHEPGGGGGGRAHQASAVRVQGFPCWVVIQFTCSFSSFLARPHWSEHQEVQGFHSPVPGSISAMVSLLPLLPVLHVCPADTPHVSRGWTLQGPLHFSSLECRLYRQASQWRLTRRRRK